MITNNQKEKHEHASFPATRRFLRTFLLASSLASVFLAGCSKEDSTGDGTPLSQDATLRRAQMLSGYQVVNLVSDVPEYNARLIDTNLVNAWGIAFGPTGGIWVSSTEKGMSTIYNKSGNILRPPVNIPFGSDPNGGEPTGQVFNTTAEFVMPGTSQASRFIFATENGTLAAWASGNDAVTVATATDGAVYKGLEMIQSGGSWYLLATDFHNGKVDMYDHNFQKVGSSLFADATIPAGFAPFNVRKLGDKVFVTYAKQEAPDNEDDEPGPGNGYVNVFNLDGTFQNRFASQGTLNSPWGMEKLRTNSGFGLDDDQGEDEDDDDDSGAVRTVILVGNFGDGHISAFDQQGNFLQYLKSNGEPVEIEGLWAISYPPRAASAYRDARNRIYFSAGPDDEAHGLFGYISRR